MMEPEQIARFTRELRAAARSADDAEGLAQLVELARQLDDVVAERARALHAEGYSWSELARPLGVSRQAARQRFGRPATPGPVECSGCGFTYPADQLAGDCPAESGRPCTAAGA